MLHCRSICNRPPGFETEHHICASFPRPTPLSRQLRTQVKRKWCSSAWPTKAGWTPSSAPSSSCSRSAPKPEEATSRQREGSKAGRFSKKKWKKTQNNWKMDPTVQPPFPPQVSKIWGYFFVCFLKAIVEHKGDLFVWPGHQSLFFYSCCWSKTKDTSYFVRRKRTPPVQGSLAGQEGNDRRRKGRRKDKEVEEPQRQVNGGATDILLTVRHKDNS